MTLAQCLHVLLDYEPDRILDDKNKRRSRNSSANVYIYIYIYINTCACTYIYMYVYKQDQAWDPKQVVHFTRASVIVQSFTSHSLTVSRWIQINHQWMRGTNIEIIESWMNAIDDLWSHWIMIEFVNIQNVIWNHLAPSATL